MVIRFEGNSPLVPNKKIEPKQKISISNGEETNSPNVKTSNPDVSFKIEESGTQPLTPEQKAAKATAHQRELDEIENMKNNATNQSGIKIVPQYNNGVLESKSHFKEGQDEPILVETFDNLGRCIKRENSVLGVVSNYTYDGMYLIQEDEIWNENTKSFENQEFEITVHSNKSHIVRKYDISQKYTGLESLSEREPISEETLEDESVSTCEIKRNYNNSEIFDNEEQADFTVKSENEVWQGEQCVSSNTTYSSGRTIHIIYDLTKPQNIHHNPDGTLMVTSGTYSNLIEKDNKGNTIEIRFDNTNNTRQIYVNGLEINDSDSKYKIKFDGLHKEIYKDNEIIKDSLIELHDNRDTKGSGNIIETDGENTITYVYKNGILRKTLYNGIIQK